MLYDLQSSLDKFRTWLLRTADYDPLMIPPVLDAWYSVRDRASIDLCERGMKGKHRWDTEERAVAMMSAVFLVKHHLGFPFYPSGSSNESIKEKYPFYFERDAFVTFSGSTWDTRREFFKSLDDAKKFCARSSFNFFYYERKTKDGAVPTFLFAIREITSGMRPAFVEFPPNDTTPSYNRGFSASLYTSHDHLFHYKGEQIETDSHPGVQKIRNWWQRIYDQVHQKNEAKPIRSAQAINLERALKFQENLHVIAGDLRKSHALLENLLQNMDNGTVGKEEIEAFQKAMARVAPELTKIKKSPIVRKTVEQTNDELRFLIAGVKKPKRKS